MILPFRLLGGWGGGGGGRFTTLGCSGCHNVAHHLLGFWGGGEGVKVDDSCCFGLLPCFLSCGAYHMPQNNITWFYLLGFLGGGAGVKVEFFNFFLELRKQ